MTSPIDVPMLIGGEWRGAKEHTQNRDPYLGSLIANVPVSTAADARDALAAAYAAKDRAAGLPAHERSALLKRTASLLRERAPEIARTLTCETGKAFRDSLLETERGADTIGIAAEEAVRIEGEHVPLDATPLGAGKLAMMLRFPVGVVVAITPYNAPVNLTCHKLGPALAAGNTVVLKPSPQSSLTVHRLVEVFVDAGWPAGFLNVVHGHEAGPVLVCDDRCEFISFTGSSRIGTEIRAASGLRRVALELGGNGITVVDEDVDLEAVASLCATNSMRLAGQSCVSVQNVYAHQSIIEELTSLVLTRIAALKVGAPLDMRTDVGTLINEQAAVRVESWVNEAAAQGAEVLAGGTRTGAQMQPTVLTRLKSSMRVVCDEVFGPVLNLLPVASFDDGLRAANTGRYGLQTGVFTRSMKRALQAARSVRAGGIIINGTSTWRADQMPYGGVKDSGQGREGPRYALRDMTEERLVVFNH